MLSIKEGIEFVLPSSAFPSWQLPVQARAIDKSTDIKNIRPNRIIQITLRISPRIVNNEVG
jgi:hypothetical protein